MQLDSDVIGLGADAVGLGDDGDAVGLVAMVERE